MVPLLRYSPGLIGELGRWAEKDSGRAMLSWRRRLLQLGRVWEEVKGVGRGWGPCRAWKEGV